jgi:hypothetical protein
MNGKTLPSVYHHKVKKCPLGFQRHDAKAVRARSKATYAANPEEAKAISAEWYVAHPEKRREYVRKSRQRNLARTLERERASWKRNRTPEKLAKMRAYSRAWRAAKLGKILTS